MQKVVLMSNVFHYYHAALALERSGNLARYITGPSACDSEAWMTRWGPLGRRVWRERRLEGLRSESVRRIWLPEILQKATTKLGYSEIANKLCGSLFAGRAARMMGQCDTLHFVQAIGWEAARKAKARGIHVVCDMREEHPEFQAEILAEEAQELGIKVMVPGSTFRYRVLEELALADRIFCPSGYAKRTFIAHGIPAGKLVVCPYGVDIGEFSPRATPRTGQPFTVLFVGQLCMRKGLHYLLEGFAKARLPNSRLVLVGRAEPDYRPVLDRYRGLYEEPGSVPRARVAEFYANADVFVIPSLADAFGLVVSEAMSAGLPVIVSENTGMADFIRDGREGFVVPIRDSAAIAEKLAFLQQNRDQCAHMGEAAAATARALDWESYQNNFARFYVGERLQTRAEFGGSPMSSVPLR
jgi:glycosyltransferase involved in cell wall biosynthesis